MPTGSGPKPGIDAVDPSSDPPGAALGRLVPQGVAERLHRVRAGHAVAVHVEQIVQVAERQLAVAAEHGETGGAQPSTPERGGIGMHQGQRPLVVGRWPPTPVGGNDRPQLLAQFVEVLEQPQPVGRELRELLVERGHPVERRVACDVDLAPDRAGEPRLEPVGEQPGRTTGPVARRRIRR